MAQDEASVITDALSMIGREGVTTRTDDTPRAIACNVVFDAVRDQVLRSHPWNSARARQAVAADATAPDFGFSRRFPLPNIPYCLRVWRLDDSKAVFRVEGRFLLTDEGSPLNIRYIFRETNAGNWDALLAEAISAKLAQRVALKLGVGRAIAADMRTLYKEIIAAARSADAQEGFPEVIEAEEFLEARR